MRHASDPQKPAEPAAPTGHRFRAGCRARSASTWERRWQSHCMLGNEAFAGGDHDLAERHYLEAIGLAQVAIGMARNAGVAVTDEKIERWLSVWVISHLNLSDLHARAARPEHALRTAFTAYEKIVDCLHDTRIATRVHHACLRHVRHVLDGLKDLMKRTGVPEDSAHRIFARAQSLALGYWNVWA